MFKKLKSAAALTILLCSASAAHEYRTGPMVIHHPFAYETAPSAKAAGGYMTIENTGYESDRLLRVEADFQRVMLHETEETDGIARMMHVEHVDIPAGGTTVLEPGSLHVMFMGLDGKPFVAGEKVPATLVFEQAGAVDIEFTIEAR